MRIAVTCCGIAALLVVRLTFADDYQVGDKVVVIEDGELTVNGNEVIDGVGPGLVFQVGAINGQWLWLNHDHPGWLEQRKVIPLDRRAIDTITGWICAHPEVAHYYYGRAIVWKNLGELDQALSDFNEAIRLKPCSAAAYHGRATLWNAKREYDKAIADCDNALRLDPQFVPAFNCRGNAWSLQHEYDKAIADYSEALALEPQNSSVYRNRGGAWFHQRKYDKAIADFNEALRINPKDAITYYDRGVVRDSLGEYEKAIADYSVALRLDPKHVLAYNNRGLAWGLQQEYDKAITDFNEALRLEPKHAMAYYNRGLMWEAQREYDKAIADYLEALRLNPNDVGYNQDIAWLMATSPGANSRNGRKAVEFARKACELTQFKDANCLDALAAAYAEAGDFNQALTWAFKAQELGTEQLRDGFQSRLNDYRSGKPYRLESKP